LSQSFASSLQDRLQLLRVGVGSAVTALELETIDVGPKYAAALAVEGSEWQMRCWDVQMETPDPKSKIPLQSSAWLTTSDGCL